MKKYREYRNGYLTLRSNGLCASVYAGTAAEWRAAMQQWSVDIGFVRGSVVPTDDGFSNTIEWGFCSNGMANVGLMQRAMHETRDRQRLEWKDDAKDLCERHEKKLFELFEALDKSSDALEERDAEVKSLKSKLAEVRRVAKAADETAEAMRERARLVDPDLIRRQIESEVKAQLDRLSEDKQQLAAQLYEARSQADKLAEDKRKLRTALNSARGRS